MSIIPEAEHDKTNKMTCAPSEDIRPVWQESSLWALGVARGPMLLHEDSDGAQVKMFVFIVLQR